jgi:ketosteroid isomerase-like protein
MAEPQLSTVDAELIEVFRRGVQAVNARDTEALVELFHADAVFVPLRAAVEGASPGHEAIRRFFADNEESFDVFHADYDDVRVVGGRALALGTLHVRGKGSGAEATRESAVVIEAREGKITRFEDFGDRTRALAAVGLSEGPLLDSGPRAE